MTRAVRQSLDSFRAEREADWIAFERALDRLEKWSARDMSEQDLLALPRLYRTTVNSLSLARAISLDQGLIAHLEALTLRGYFALYGGRSRLGPRIARFFARDWPLAVAGLGRETLFMLALLVIGAVAGFQLVASDPLWFDAMIPAGLAAGRGPDSGAEALRAALFDGGDGFLSGFAMMLFVNNSQVAILAFTLGFAFGLPTILLVLANGCILGAFIQIYVAHGLGGELGGWLFIHGTTELLAVAIAGAAGLRIGAAVAFPGDLTRLDSAARAGRRAATAMVGVLVMLAAAGLLEGIGRQVVDSTAARYAIGGAILIFWCLYFYLLPLRLRADD